MSLDQQDNTLSRQGSEGNRESPRLTIVIPPSPFQTEPIPHVSLNLANIIDKISNLFQSPNNIDEAIDSQATKFLLFEAIDASSQVAETLAARPQCGPAASHARCILYAINHDLRVRLSKDIGPESTDILGAFLAIIAQYVDDCRLLAQTKAVMAVVCERTCMALVHGMVAALPVQRNAGGQVARLVVRTTAKRLTTKAIVLDLDVTRDATTTSTSR